MYTVHMAIHNGQHQWGSTEQVGQKVRFVTSQLFGKDQVEKDEGLEEGKTYPLLAHTHCP